MTTEEGRRAIEQVAHSVDVILMIRVLNHIDAPDSARILDWIRKVFPEALLVLANPSEGSAEADEQARIGQLADHASITDWLNSKSVEESFFGVSYPFFRRSPASYRGALEATGYTSVRLHAINTSGEANRVTHFVALASAQST